MGSILQDMRDGEVRAVVAQLGGPTGAEVPPLPAAPAWEVWLLESPAIAAAVLGVLGCVLLVRRGLWSRAAGGLLIVAGLGVFGAGWLVQTPREAMSERTRELVAAVAGGEAGAMRGLLDEAVTVASARGQSRGLPVAYEGREAIIAAATSRLPGLGIRRVAVLEVRAAVDGPEVGRTHVRVRAEGEGGAWLGHAWWEIDWVRRDQGWLAAEIEPLWVQGR
jgi:hypothetical protein